jgi:hypothetical protein
MSRNQATKNCPKCKATAKCHQLAQRCLCGGWYECPNCAERRHELRLLAKLAAKKPMFFNPLEAFAAETLRDRILAEIEAAT